ncbi:alpha/beta hydrolase [Mycobacterium sp. MYCO198283]|uniref:alpha/beta fold hydrolase n=1 Tax=Mycobacterium sp. MYCO198283 TaxID=2883505 RepID=UPI001E2CBF1B|nr:alpha/beta hydrolase family protein [Mycobacterium sp. MYCO198283]MCG5434242.1 alpha/beta hydrolase [Mycobacterium sp. MYCO198283]
MTPLAAADPQPVVADVDGVPMSGLRATAAAPRAAVVAFHGGATTSAYFDCPDLPRLSLLRLGAALGFSVLALDRPGYGASAPHAESMMSPQYRVDLSWRAVDALLPPAARGAGVFLLGHSIGSEHALRLATDPRGATLLGLEISATGRAQQPAARRILETAAVHEIPKGLGDLLWRPDALYPPQNAGGRRIASRGCRWEGPVAAGWREDLPAMAARLDVPVRFSLGDHERVWENGPAALTAVAALFTASPRAVWHEQHEAGHNLSLGHTATAYHLSLLAFVEECVAAAGLERTADHERKAG